MSVRSFVLLALLAISTLIAASSGAHASNSENSPSSFIVEPPGNDEEGAGSSSDTTLEDALRRASPGDRIVLQPGLYAAARIVEIHGSPQAPITIAAAAPGVVFSDDDYNARPAISIEESSHIVLQGIEAERSLSGVSIQQSNSVVVRNVTVTDVGQEGIHVQHGSYDIDIVDNFIADTGRRTDKVGNYPAGNGPAEGIYVGSGRSNGSDEVWNIRISGNEITRTRHEAIDIKAPAFNITISDNLIHDIGTFVSGAVVFHLNEHNTADPNIVFERNEVRDVRSTSPHRDGNCVVVSTYVTIRNNLLQGCQHRGIFVHDGFPTTFDGEVLIYGNTIDRPGSVGAIVLKFGSSADPILQRNLIIGQVETNESVDAPLAAHGNIQLTAADGIDGAVTELRLPRLLWNRPGQVVVSSVGYGTQEAAAFGT